MGIWKKVGLATLAAGLTVGLAACGSKSSESNQKTLTVTVDKGYKDYINDIKGDFEKKNGVKVVVKTKDALTTLDSLKLDGPAGKAADVMMAPFDRVAVLGKQGQLATVKLADDGRYNDADKKNVTLKGKTYGEPVTIETLVMYYNKDLIKKAPTSFKELEALSKDSKFAYENDKTKNVAFLTQWTNFYNAYGLIKGYGGYVFGDNGTNPKEIGLNNKGAVEGLTYISDWFKNVWPKGMMSASSNENFVTDQFTSGKTAVIIDGPWMAAKYKKAKVNYGVAALPTLDNGNKYQAFGGGKAWVISNYSKQKGLSQKWLDYVTNKKNQTKFFKDTNEVPANEQARDAVAKGDNDLAKAVIAQYKDADPMPNIPEMAEVWTGAENLIVDSAAGKKTPQQAADAAVKQIKQTIQQKYKD
ncbi:sugar ABC transporter substrate-binding protein [Ligilactobacillus agilis]|uniref:Maltodextrin-binding protein n=1 Tax=Ligilactobacillus agilis TaxID=1601 RepID=A0A231QIY5_9LACO|nr:extracellular solute-binding protein [Ligilactobacillus agilis]MBM6762309.1 extracellular solute-binding protein [Ligilactobacillus agilis]MDK6809882.1 extracellular solute-binding protein [Ligilactobacillus agilis]NJE32441.1 extracellular solute-binding protein [Ligilactobacillus agilis]OXC09287.1 sugar ABC transporter substrate-binding protein [Ligilactobacillus agilis]OXC09795.1 sugar ABC transporter substrate-binding protein [Ligilactobacillus agilis]